MISFKGITKEEAKRTDIAPEGEYDFEIIDAEEKKSKNGNDMIVLELKAFYEDAVEGEDDSFPVTHYMVFSDKTRKQIFSTCEALGLADECEAGTLSDIDFTGKCGRAMIGIEKGTGDYPDKNRVKWFCRPEIEAERSVTQKKSLPSTADMSAEDDIPF